MTSTLFIAQGQNTLKSKKEIIKILMNMIYDIQQPWYRDGMKDCNIIEESKYMLHCLHVIIFGIYKVITRCALNTNAFSNCYYPQAQPR
jgi:hypothetical protein